MERGGEAGGVELGFDGVERGVLAPGGGEDEGGAGAADERVEAADAGGVELAGVPGREDAVDVEEEDAHGPGERTSSCARRG